MKNSTFNILFSLFLLFGINFVFSQDDYPPIYEPNNTRNVTAYPAPLLAINGQYGIWFKTGVKNLTEENRIIRPFIICEGFDVANDIEFIDLYEQLNNNRQYEKHI